KAEPGVVIGDDVRNAVRRAADGREELAAGAARSQGSRLDAPARSRYRSPDERADQQRQDERGKRCCTAPSISPGCTPTSADGPLLRHKPPSAKCLKRRNHIKHRL